MEHFDPCLPPLPQTGTTGGSILLFLVAIGALTLAVSALSSSFRRSGAALGLLVIMGGLAAALNLTPGPAFAETIPDHCITAQPTTVAPTGAQTPSPAGGPTPEQAPTVGTTAAPSPTPTATLTPTPAPVPRSISGMVGYRGTVVLARFQADMYLTPPKPSPILPELAPVALNGMWEIPRIRTLGTATTYSPGQETLITVHNPGADGILGNGDDQLVASAPTDANGVFTFPNLPAGRYRVVTTYPEEPDFASAWLWGECKVSYQSSDPTIPNEEMGYQLATPGFYDVTLSDQTPIAEVNFNFDVHIGLAAFCRPEK